MSIIRDVAYEAKVEGFDQVSAEIERLDDAAASAEKAVEQAGDAAEDLARDYAKADAAASKMADGLKKAEGAAKQAGDGVKKGGSALEAFEKQIGFVSKAIGGFGLLALPGAIEGVIDLATRFYEWTDAGKAAQQATEAHNTALQATVDLLTGVSDASRVATSDLVAYYRVRKAAETIEVELNELLDQRLKLDGQLRNARLGGDVNAQKKYSAAITDTDRQLARLKDRLSEVTAEQKALTDAVEDAGAAMTGDPLALLGDAFGKFGDLSKKVGDETKRNAEKGAAEAARLASARLAHAQGLRDRELALIEDQGEREMAILEENHKRQLAMFDEAATRGEVNPADRDCLLNLQAEEAQQLSLAQAMKAAEESLASQAKQRERAAQIESARVAMLEGLVDREIALIQDRDAQALASMEERFRREQALIDKQISEGIASEEDRTRLIKVQEGERALAAEESAAEAEKAGNKREEAAAKEASAYAASAEAALGAAASLADALGASAAVIAGIKGAQEVAAAASEVALAASSAAVYDVPGAIAHGVAAAEHVVAAVKWGDDALGGKKKSGASAKKASAPTKASATNKETVNSGDRERNRPSPEPPLNLYFQGQPLETRTDIQDAVVTARREAYRRRGGARDGGWQRRR